MFVVFADRGYGAGVHAEKAGREVPGRVGIFAVDDGGGRGHAARCVRIDVAEGAEASDQDGGFCSQGTGERVCLVEDEVVQPGIGE